MSDLSFVEVQPDPALRPYIDFLWMLNTRSPGDSSASHLVFPDGGMDIIVPWSWSSSSLVVPGRLSISGIASYSRTAPLGSVAAIVGARFKPGAAFALLSVPAPDVKDTVVPLEELVEPERRGTCEFVTHASSPRDCLQRLEKMLLATLTKAASIDPVVTSSVRLMQATHGAIRMSDLEERGISTRTLRRRFDRIIGMSPKQFCRILRFSHAVELARSSVSPNWSDLAVAAGYYDQSHLIQEFIALAGTTPHRHFTQTTPVRFFQYARLDAF